MGYLVEFGIDLGRESSAGRNAVQKPIASLMAVGLLLLAACGTAEVEPGPITSFDDIAGTTYERQGPGTQLPHYVQFSEDGTVNWSTNPDLIEDSPNGVMETRFEGTKIFTTPVGASAFPCGVFPEAIYEIHLLENGNLQFVTIEDLCAHRSRDLSETEWAPVP